MDVKASFVFPQGMLEAVALVGDEARDGETKAWTDCEAGLLCSVALAVLSGPWSALQ